MSTTQDRESELYKIIENLEETQYQCNRDERQIEQMEEDALWQNRKSTELGARRDAEERIDDYREELRKLREDKNNEDNNYDYPAPTC